LKQSIDDFVDQELKEYTLQIAMFKSRRARSTTRSSTEPKKPSIFDDRLTPEDWSIIAQYTQVLKPLKLATMLLQGYVKDVETSSKVVIGGLWIGCLTNKLFYKRLFVCLRLGKQIQTIRWSNKLKL
jgi:hypothetical protein